jgi:hypothetical protein
LDGRAAFRDVLSTFIKKISGDAWARTPEMAKQFEMPELAQGG